MVLHIRLERDHADGRLVGAGEVVDAGVVLVEVRAPRAVLCVRQHVALVRYGLHIIFVDVRRLVERALKTDKRLFHTVCCRGRVIGFKGLWCQTTSPAT